MNLGDKFSEKIGERRTQKQFKNKWDALKKDYTGWMELQNATGLGWDPIAKTMDADDDWWKNHLAIHVDHAKFRNGSPANLEQQDVMFRKDDVTRESAAIAGEEEGNGKEAPIILDDTSKITGKRKHVEKDFFSSYNNALNTIVSRNTEGSSCSKGDEVPTMKEFLGMVRDCGVLEGTTIMYTAGKLADEGSTRQCSLLWTWVLEKEGTLEIVEPLTYKQYGTRGLPRFRPPEGPTPACLLLINSGTEGYRVAQIGSGVCMLSCDVSPPRRAILTFI